MTQAPSGTPGEQQSMWKGKLRGTWGAGVPLPDSKSQASLSCAIIYFNAFVAHVRVQVKYGCTVYWWGC